MLGWLVALFRRAVSTPVTHVRRVRCDGRARPPWEIDGGTLGGYDGGSRFLRADGAARGYELDGVSTTEGNG